jgi:hypothetical protein
LTSNPADSFKQILGRLADPPDPVPARRLGLFGGGTEVFLKTAEPAKPATRGFSAYHAITIPPAIEESARFLMTVADVELQLRRPLAAAQLRLLRRQFAAQRHPDLVRDVDRDAACRDMAAVNRLIDAALSKLTTK